ncbi:MFS transporter [Actinoallomurus rhizosphaericola]|uniref:MFS transporter n=1 Tax=Actinoallomurus rhizosphaericola TaxID=2952536 RepID=UPI0027E34479|nr:MFS transporter [Actinoallomurus rhizosphaericola]
MNADAAAGEEPVPASRHRPVGGLLRTRNFALLWIGESTSAVGSAVTTVALPLVAVSTLHSGPAMVSLLTAATWLPWLLIGLPAGVWVDRWPRRRTLLIADLVSAVALVIIPIAAWTHVLTMTMVLVGALLAGTAGVFFNVAFNAFLPHLVSADDLLEGNARLQTSASVALIVGPGLAGCWLRRPARSAGSSSTPSPSWCRRPACSACGPGRSRALPQAITQACCASWPKASGSSCADGCCRPCWWWRR